jgi:hypothetical protein
VAEPLLKLIFKDGEGKGRITLWQIFGSLTVGMGFGWNWLRIVSIGGL